MVVSICLLILGQHGELVEEPLLLFLRQTIEKLLRTLLLGLLLLRSCLLRPESLLLRLLELLLLPWLRLLLLLLLWSKRLPCLLLRLKLLLGVKLSLKLLLLLRSQLLLTIKLLLLLRLEALVLRLELLLRPRLVRLETSTVVGLSTEWLETLLPELALLEQSQLLTGSEDKSFLAFQVADKDTTLLSRKLLLLLLLLCGWWRVDGGCDGWRSHCWHSLQCGKGSRRGDRRVA